MNFVKRCVVRVRLLPKLVRDRLFCLAQLSLERCGILAELLGGWLEWLGPCVTEMMILLRGIFGVERRRVAWGGTSKCQYMGRPYGRDAVLPSTDLVIASPPLTLCDMTAFLLFMDSILRPQDVRLKRTKVTGVCQLTEFGQT